MQCSGTGPLSRQLQDKVGGVAPAGLFLDQAASSGSAYRPDRRQRGQMLLCYSQPASRLFSSNHIELAGHFIMCGRQTLE
jgi:hypothetical protein